MRIELRLIALALLMLFFTAACSTGNSDEDDQGSVEIAGPALVMFYTDN